MRYHLFLKFYGMAVKIAKTFLWKLAVTFQSHTTVIFLWSKIDFTIIRVAIDWWIFTYPYCYIFFPITIKNLETQKGARGSVTLFENLYFLNENWRKWKVWFLKWPTILEGSKWKSIDYLNCSQKDCKMQ